MSMENINYNIFNTFSHNKEFCRLLPLIKDVAIIEYDGEKIDSCRAVAKYYEDNALDKSAVKEIMLLGCNKMALKANKEEIGSIFPTAKVTIPFIRWKDFKCDRSAFSHSLVIHNGTSLSFTTEDFDYYGANDAILFRGIVNSTRTAYYFCILKNNATSFYHVHYSSIYKFRLLDFKFNETENEPKQNDFCINKDKYLKICTSTLIPKDSFFQCMDEVRHGCEECNLCGNYEKQHYCPLSQRAIAQFYREGMFVPKDEHIAHQWETMAARQGYKPAIIQIADDFKEGVGCHRDYKRAAEIYSKYAFNTEDEHCLKELFDIVEKTDILNDSYLLPYISNMAKEGNEDMIMKLSNGFLNGEYGLPIDIIQQKEWIEQAAVNGNPRFVKAMAEMYKKKGQWEEAYKWYKTLDRVSPCSGLNEIIDEIELHMLTDGYTPEEIAFNGECYLYGFYGKPRDIHFAYRCLKYASDFGVAKAIGLQGLMYYEGLEVKKDTVHGLKLLTAAAEAGDIISIYKLINLNQSERNNSPNADRWQNVLINRIEEAISEGITEAFYLKSHLLSAGYLYDKDVDEAFNLMFEAARRRSPKGQYHLALMFKDGIGTTQNEESFMYWLKTSSNNGYYEAKGKLVCILSNGLSKYDSSTFELLKSSYDQGCTDVYWCLAQAYMYGFGTAKNEEKAYPLYIQAAENDISEAQEKLCADYFKGNEVLPKDYKECVKWGEKALSHGKRDIRFELAYASSELGYSERSKELYLELSNEGNHAAMNNYACEISDVKEKIEWFQKASDMGDDYGSWNLGKYYRDGNGVPQDIKKAINLFTIAADKGHTGAMRDLALLHRYGRGIEKDCLEAEQWYKKAIEKGKKEWITELADFYLEETGIADNFAKAILCYKKAVEINNVYASYKLGEIYEKGNGVDVNYASAIYWYRKAALKDYNPAKESLKRLHANWIEERGNEIVLT